jgi:glutamyl-tRNA reductase
MESSARRTLDILVVGLNHKSAPLEVLEKLSFSKEQLSSALSGLRDQVGESIILSTCNRTEIYAASDEPAETKQQIADFVAGFHGIDIEAITPHFYAYHGADAVSHLLGVASGLDSLIVGESQILGQVRDAMTVASETGSAQVPLVGLFHAAVRTGRRVREETEVGRNALSISYAGVQLAKRTLGSLEGLKVLLVGAGEAGRLVANALRTVGVGELVIANRTQSRGEELADSLGGSIVPFAELDEALGKADIAIAATDAPNYVITQDMVVAAVDRRGESPLFLIDLAVPRDIDPQVADLEGVKLFNIDDLSSIAEENLEARKRAAVHAETIVGDEVARFMKWWDSLDAVPIIKTLQRQAEEIRKRELDHALHDMPDIQSEHVAVVDALTRSIVKKILHDPTVFLRERADKSQLEAARDLFRLWEDPERD